MDCDDIFPVDSLSFDSNLDSLIEADYELGLELPFPSHSQMSSHANEGVDLVGVEGERDVETADKHAMFEKTADNPGMNPKTIEDIVDEPGINGNMFEESVTCNNGFTEEISNVENQNLLSDFGSSKILNDTAIIEGAECPNALLANESSVIETKVDKIEQLDLTNLKEKRRKRLAEKSKNKSKTSYESSLKVTEKLDNPVNMPGRSKKRKGEATDEASQTVKKSKALDDVDASTTCPLKPDINVNLENAAISELNRQQADVNVNVVNASITEIKRQPDVSVENAAKRELENQPNLPIRYTTTTKIIDGNPDIQIKDKQQEIHVPNETQIVHINDGENKVEDVMQTEDDMLAVDDKEDIEKGLSEVPETHAAAVDIGENQVKLSEYELSPANKDDSENENDKDKKENVVNRDEDDVNAEDDYNDNEYEEEDFEDDDLNTNEVDAWLEEGVETKKDNKHSDEVTSETDLGNGKYMAKEKFILEEKGSNPFEVLPEGWLMVIHNSGMPVFLHKPTRVCTMSRPYFIGQGSVRKHEIPLSSIPCLQYRRELEKEKKQQRDIEDGTSTAVQDGTNLAVQNGSNTTEQSKLDMAAVQNENEKQGEVTNDLPTPVIATVEGVEKEVTVGPDELLSYCSSLFQFKTITIKKFQTWREKRTHLREIHEEEKKQLPQMAADTKLIVCPIPKTVAQASNKKRKDFVINPEGKSAVCILHEYTQHVLRVKPTYIFSEIENQERPYKATINIDGIGYGSGVGSCKRKAKAEAAKTALKVFIPQLAEHWNDTDSKLQNRDLSYFEEVTIEDPRVTELCDKAALQKPFHLLTECLRRNYGMGDINLHVEKKLISNQKTEFSLTVGKHTATVTCKNKLEGKQRAAQGMLQKLHPQLKNWAAILRLYNQNTEVGFHEREEEVPLQSNMKDFQLLDKLKEAMRKSRYHQGQKNKSNFTTAKLNANQHLDL